jgi:hypothetical protein
MNILSIYLNDVKQLCDSYRVRSLFAFGSVTTERFNANSDIDFIVDIADDDPLSYSDKYFDLKSRLEELFKRKIDLLEHKTIINPYLKARIDQIKVLVYGN